MDEKEAEARPLMGTIFLVHYLIAKTGEGWWRGGGGGGGGGRRSANNNRTTRSTRN